MYPNLEAELRRKKIRRIDLAKHLHKAISTVSLMLTGKADISLGIALQIKTLLNSNLPLEVLFKSNEP